MSTPVLALPSCVFRLTSLMAGGAEPPRRGRVQTALSESRDSGACS